MKTKLEEVLQENRFLKAELEKSRAQLQEKNMQVDAYFQASSAVLGLETFEEAARKLFDICIGLIGATSGYIALLSEDGYENEVLFLEAGGRPCSVDPNLPMPIRGLRAESYRDQIVVTDNDFMNSQWLAFMPDGHVTLDNVLFAPLNIDNKTVGIMGIANKPGSFTEQDKQIAGAFGELAAIALREVWNKEKLYRLTQDLQQSNRELEAFAHILSHDIKEPLRTISSYLSLIQNRYQNQLDENADEFINFAVEGAKRLTEMSTSLLHYARITTKKRPFKLTPLEKIVKEVIVNLESLIKENQAEIHFGNLPTLNVDAIQISQLLQNLISNSIKYKADSPPIIHIDTEENEKEFIIRVKDNGIGFDDEKYGKEVFSLFRRLDNEKQGGLGIGLATCAKVIDHHQGKIWAKSSPGKGATFYFSIPKGTKPTE